MTSEPSDQELLAAIQRKEIRSLELIYDRYGTFAFSLAARILEDKALAEDVVQEVFFNLWRQASTFDVDKGSVRNWLLSCTHHRAIDFLRQRQGKTRRDFDINEAEYLLKGPDPWEEVARNGDRELLKKAISQLPQEQRKTLEMAYFGGLSHAEVAEAMRVPLGTVKGRLRLAVEKLREFMMAQGIRTLE
jgi:RNA polymerase sigma-70 factor (ECF subfamily)